MIATIFSIDLANVITTTLLHSIWQITLIAVVYKYAKDKLYSDNSNRVAQLGVGLLLISIASTVLTFVYCYGSMHHWLLTEENTTSALLQFSGRSSEEAHSIISPDINGPWISNLNLHITITWLLGVLMLMGRIFWGYLGLQRLKRSLNYTLPKAILESFSEISRTLKVSKKVLVASSDKIDIPMVFGHLKPIIVLPIATINQLSTKEVEFILAHELGHVLRHDYLQNLILIVTESIFFFHPLVWWMTSEIKQSREHHCDEISIECFPDRIEYAKSLLKIQSLPHTNKKQLSIALFTNKPLLMNRIKRILKQPVNSTSQFASSTGIAVVILFIGLFVGVSWISKENNSEFNKENSPTNEVMTFESSSITTPMIVSDTIDPNTQEIEEAHARIAELQEEIRMQQEEKLEQMREIKDQFEAQMLEEKEELKSLKRKYTSERNQAYSQRNRVLSERNHRKLEERLEAIGEKMEEWIDENDDEWEIEMEELGERISETFDQEWVEKMENAAEAFEDEFDEEWSSEIQKKAKRLQREVESEDFIEGISEFSAAMAELGAEIGISVAEAMNEIDFEGLEYDIEYGEAEDSDDLKKSLGEAMAEDFDLKRGKNKLRLTEDQLIVNGSRASNSLQQKYKDIVQESNSRLFDQAKAEVKFYFFGKDINESDKTSLSISIED